MAKIVVEITGKSGKSFELTLNDTAWIGVAGTWSCLPGYLPAMKGYFDLETTYSVLYLQDRERGMLETVGWVLEDPGTPSPNKLWGSLDAFSSSPAAGQSGKGNIFDYGTSAKPILKDVFGTVSSSITWKIKSVG